MKRQTGSFVATGDDGREYTVYIYTEFVDAGSRRNPRAVVQGLKELRTSDGMAVNRLQKGEYQIEETGVVLRSDSADAP